MTSSGAVTADGSSTATITGTGATPNSLVTVSTTLGTITTADASATYTGLQVQANSSGNFSFTLQAPLNLNNVTATLSAVEVSGATAGSGSQSFTAVSTARFDFLGSSSDPVTPGFVGLLGNATYNATTGYGWQTAVSNFDRGTANATPVSLYQDGAWGTSPGVFEIAAVPNSTYSVRVYIGDQSNSWGTVTVSVEGGGSASVVTKAGVFQYVVLTGTSGSNGIWTVTIQNASAGATWVTNGMDFAAGGSGNLPSLPQLLQGPEASTADAGSLTEAELAPVVQEAIQRRVATGLTPAQAAVLEQVHFGIANLSAEGELGQDSPGQVLLDAAAGGYGWYIDASPSSDAAFSQQVGSTELEAAAGSPAAGRIDLLTVVMHELGHELGLPDLTMTAAPDALMAVDLGAGVRRLPTALPGEGVSNPALSAGLAAAEVQEQPTVAGIGSVPAGGTDATLPLASVGSLGRSDGQADPALPAVRSGWQADPLIVDGMPGTVVAPSLRGSQFEMGFGVAVPELPASDELVEAMHDRDYVLGRWGLDDWPVAMLRGCKGRVCILSPTARARLRWPSFSLIWARERNSQWLATLSRSGPCVRAASRERERPG